MMIPDGWKVERLKHTQGAIAVTNGYGFSREIYNYRDPLMYRFFDDLLRQTESEAPKPRKDRGRATHAQLTAQADEIDLLTKENADLKAQIARDDEHYKAAMVMSEKHRRNWVEACQQNAELREKADQYLSVLEDLVSWFPDAPSHEWRIKAGESGADDAIEYARKTIDAAMAKESK
jgi:hypothetical protein